MDNTIYVFVKQNENKGILQFPKCGIETTAYIGTHGLTNQKTEGDGKTPIGIFSLGNILGKEPCIQNMHGLFYRQITADMYWVDDPKSVYYNQLVHIREVNKDWNSAEQLIDYPIAYAYIIEIKTNPENIPGNGSAIFLHCLDKGATAGCVAVDKEMMKMVIEHIDADTKIQISRSNKKIM